MGIVAAAAAGVELTSGPADAVGTSSFHPLSAAPGVPVVIYPPAGAEAWARKKGQEHFKQVKEAKQTSQAFFRVETLLGRVANIWVVHSATAPTCGLYLLHLRVPVVGA